MPSKISKPIITIDSHLSYEFIFIWGKKEFIFLLLFLDGNACCYNNQKRMSITDYTHIAIHIFIKNTYITN